MENHPGWLVWPSNEQTESERYLFLLLLLCLLLVACLVVVVVVSCWQQYLDTDGFVRYTVSTASSTGSGWW
jgi:sensor domain CHASE-containing protein